MSNNKGKISLKQAVLLFIVLFCAPSIRFMASYTAPISKQASWLVPFVSMFFYIILILVIYKIFKKYDKESFVEIMQDILGKKIGGILIFLFFLAISFDLSYNIRIFSERLLGSVIPNIDIIVIIGAILALTFYILKDGIVPLARMNEIFLIFIILILVISTILVLPNLDVSNLFPITYKDIVPVFNANIGIVAIFSYITVFFMFSDKIVDRKDFKKISVKLILALTIISLIAIACPIGVFGWSLVSKMPIPFINTVMEISFFDTIERIEAFVVMFWILADFVSICVLTYSAIHIISVYFKINKTNSVLSIYIVSMFFMSLCIAKSTVELNALSKYVIVPLNIVMGYFIPIIVLIVGKVRKKI